MKYLNDEIKGKIINLSKSDAAKYNKLQTEKDNNEYKKEQEDKNQGKNLSMLELGKNSLSATIKNTYAGEILGHFFFYDRQKDKKKDLEEEDNEVN